MASGGGSFKESRTVTTSPSRRAERTAIEYPPVGFSPQYAARYVPLPEREMFVPVASDRAAAEEATTTRGRSGPWPGASEERRCTRRSRGASVEPVVSGASWVEGSEPLSAEHPAANTSKSNITPARTIPRRSYHRPPGNGR